MAQSRLVEDGTREPKFTNVEEFLTNEADLLEGEYYGLSNGDSDE